MLGGRPKYLFTYVFTLLTLKFKVIIHMLNEQDLHLVFSHPFWLEMCNKPLTTTSIRSSRSSGGLRLVWFGFAGLLRSTFKSDP